MNSVHICLFLTRKKIHQGYYIRSFIQRESRRSRFFRAFNFTINGNLKENSFFFSLQGLLSEYDFIIIGAGSAGAVIANRLPEIDEWKILLLEAGGDESFLGQVPAMAADLQRTEQDWQFKTEVLSGQACLGMENQR